MASSLKYEIKAVNSNISVLIRKIVTVKTIAYLFPWGFLLLEFFSLLELIIEGIPLEIWFFIWVYDSSKTKGPGKLEA